MRKEGERRRVRHIRHVPLSDLLELSRIVDGDVDSEVHSLLGKVDVETGDLGSLDSSLHGCGDERSVGQSLVSNLALHFPRTPFQPRIYAYDSTIKKRAHLEKQRCS